MVKVDKFDLDFLETAPQGERRRDIRIKNRKTKEESDNNRRSKLGNHRRG